MSEPEVTNRIRTLARQSIDFYRAWELEGTFEFTTKDHIVVGIWENGLGHTSIYIKNNGVELFRGSLEWIIKSDEPFENVCPRCEVNEITEGDDYLCQECRGS